MEVLNPIYITPNMAMLTKMKILNIHFALPNERDGVNRMFPFAKRDVVRGSRYKPKNN